MRTIEAERSSPDPGSARNSASSLINGNTQRQNSTGLQPLRSYSVHGHRLLATDQDKSDAASACNLPLRGRCKDYSNSVPPKSSVVESGESQKSRKQSERRVSPTNERHIQARILEICGILRIALDLSPPIIQHPDSCSPRTAGFECCMFT